MFQINELWPRSAKKLDEYLIETLSDSLIYSDVKFKPLRVIYPRYGEFQDKYVNDLRGFVDDCIEWSPSEKPTAYQVDALIEFENCTRYSLRGPRGLGKTTISSWVVHWFALTRDGDDWKIPTTASSWTQLTKFLWPEIHKWKRRLRWDIIGRPPYQDRKEALMLNLRLQTGEAFAVSHQNSDLIEGAHAKRILFLFDEAKSINDSIFDSAEGSLTNASDNEESRALAVSTPGAPMGRFYDIHIRKPGYEDWRVKTVRRDEVIAAGRMTQTWADQRKKQWGEKSALYLNHVEGEFASADSNSIIPLHWVELANERWLQWQEESFPGMFTGVGVDVGGGGDNADKTTLAPCFDYQKIKDIIILTDLSRETATMQTADRVSSMLTAFGGGVAVVDAIGIGAGVLARIVQKKLNGIPFIASASTDFKDGLGVYGFSNWRSAAWWMTREILDPDSNFSVCLPPSEDLTAELTTPIYKVSNGKYSVESKIDIRKRLGRSTDLADSVIQILIGPILYQASIENNQKLGYQPVTIGPDY